jgi:hypothetical protein
MTGMAVLLLVRPIVRHRDRFAQRDERGDGWSAAGQSSGRYCAGGIHHAKQWRLDHVRQIPELTACDTGDHRGDHRLAAITSKFDINEIIDYNNGMQTEAPT